MLRLRNLPRILIMETRTVVFHKHRMKGALNAKSTAELIRYAVRHHLVAA